jgi:hypothetical protein
MTFCPGFSPNISCFTFIGPMQEGPLMNPQSYAPNATAPSPPSCASLLFNGMVSLSCSSHHKTDFSSALREIELIVCLCRPATDQLIRRGLFPCSPLQPSLAVDLSLLEIITSSFYHLTLNTTGWAILLEQHWRWNGYALQFEVGMDPHGINANIP